jgi:hypothetical protein
MVSLIVTEEVSSAAGSSPAMEIASALAVSSLFEAGYGRPLTRDDVLGMVSRVAM